MSKVMPRHSAQCCLRMGQEVTRHYFIEAPFSPEKLATPSHQSAALLLAASSAATWKGVRHPRPLTFSHSDKQERCLRPHLQLETVLQQCLQLLLKNTEMDTHPKRFSTETRSVSRGFSWGGTMFTVKSAWSAAAPSKADLIPGQRWLHTLLNLKLRCAGAGPAWWQQLQTAHRGSQGQH